LEEAAVHLSLSELGADDARLDTLTRQVRDELRQLDVSEVLLAAGGSEPPPGSRGVDAAAVGQIVVGMLGTQGLAGLISTVLGWLGRGHDAPRTVRLELDGDVLELAGASSDEQDRLVALFLTKHSGKD
jgi:hypothetical protein